MMLNFLANSSFFVFNFFADPLSFKYAGIFYFSPWSLYLGDESSSQTFFELKQKLFPLICFSRILHYITEILRKGGGGAWFNFITASSWFVLRRSCPLTPLNTGYRATTGVPKLSCALDFSSHERVWNFLQLYVHPRGIRTGTQGTQG